MTIHEAIKIAKKFFKENERLPTRKDLMHLGLSDWFLHKHNLNDILNKADLLKYKTDKIKIVKPKILVFDIETLPIEAYVWKVWDENIGVNQIKKDFTILSFSAKWVGENKCFYESVEKEKDIRNDKNVLKKIWKLLNQADLLVSQNGVKFDIKKLNARFAFHDMTPTRPCKHFDLLLLAKRKFGFTSNKLAYLSNMFNKRHKKLSHKKFEGFELWNEILREGEKQVKKRKSKVWEELEKYNVKDVLSLEELYLRFRKWDNSISFSPFQKDMQMICECGSNEFVKNGFMYSPKSVRQRYTCQKCKRHFIHGKNMLNKNEIRDLFTPV